MRPLILEVRPLLGTSIEAAVGEAVRIAKLLGVYVRFTLNGSPVTATPDSDPAELVKRWGTDGRQ